MNISPQAEFWRFLQAAGVIPEATADGIAQEVRDQWMPLGRILLREKKLTVDEMKRLLEMQAANPGMRVGDLAVREGFCSVSDIEEAVQFQHEQCGEHPLARLLVQADELDHEALFQALYGYVRHLEGRVQILDHMLSAQALGE